MEKNKVYRNIGLSPILDNLLIADSIVKQKSVTAIAEDIIEAHYTDSTSLHRKLNFIIKHIEHVTGTKSGLDTDPKDLFELPIPIGEIQAARFNRKKYKKKEHRTAPIQQTAPPTDFRAIDQFLKK
jgi:hypothetical protein